MLDASLLITATNRGFTSIIYISRGFVAYRTYAMCYICHGPLAKYLILQASSPAAHHETANHMIVLQHLHFNPSILTHPDREKWLPSGYPILHFPIDPSAHSAHVCPCILTRIFFQFKTQTFLGGYRSCLDPLRIFPWGTLGPFENIVKRLHTVRR